MIFGRTSVWVICSAVTLCSCAAPYRSTPLSSETNETLTTPNVGLVYYLPKAYVPSNIAGTPPASAGKPYQLNLSFSNPIYVTDSTKSFFLTARHNPFSDDHFTIKVDQNGLLQTVSLQATDQTGQILAQLAQVAAQVVTIPASFGLGASTTPSNKAAIIKPRACSLPAYQWSENLAPTPGVPTPLDLPTLQSSTNSLEYVKLKIAYVAQAGAPVETVTVAPSAVDGIYFRMPVPYELTIFADASPQAQADCLLPAESKQGAEVSLPNGGKLFAENVSRAFSVQRTIGLTVQNGMLTGVDDTHPSEIYGLAQIPGKILAPIVAIPSNLFTIHLQKAQGEGSLTAADATILQNQLNIINNQTALSKAQEALTPGH